MANTDKKFEAMVTELKQVARHKTTNEQTVSVDDLRHWSTVQIFNAGIDDGKIYQARITLGVVGIDWQEEK